MKRYFKLFLTFTQNNLIRDMEYRANFLIQVALAACWVTLQVVVLEIYFGFTNNISGWTKGEVFVLVGMFRLTKATFDMFFRQNLFSLPENVSRGELDYTLTKPVDSLFMMSARYQIHGEISSLLVGVAVLLFGLNEIGVGLSLLLIVQLFALTIMALCAYYSIFTLFATITIFSTRLYAINDFNELVSQTLRYPTDVYTRASGALNFLLLPFIVIATLPAKIFLDKVSVTLMLLELVIGVALLFLTYRFWNFALKHYSSASS